MNNRMSILKWFVILLFCFPVLAQEDQWLKTRSEQIYEFKGAKSIRVVNSYGDIRVKKAPFKDRFLLIGNVQQKKEDTFKLKYDPVLKGEEVLVNVTLFSQTEDKKEDTLPRRVDLSILVPVEWECEFETQSGKIDARDMIASVKASSFSGRIYIRTAGVAKCINRQGETVVYLTDQKALSSSFESITGDIEVGLSSKSDCQITASTTGQISSDFSMTIDRQPGSTIKHMKILMGKETAQLAIKSKHGKVKVLHHEP